MPRTGDSNQSALPNFDDTVEYPVRGKFISSQASHILDVWAIPKERFDDTGEGDILRCKQSRVGREQPEGKKLHGVPFPVFIDRFRDVEDRRISR